MNLLMLGIGIYILGFIITVISAGIFDTTGQSSYYYRIIFSILYLSAIVGVSTSLILRELRKKDSS